MMGYPPEEVNLPKMDEIERVKEEIFKILFPYADTKRASDDEMINQILSIKGIAVLSDNQSKPQNPYYRVLEGNDRVMPEDTPEEFAYRKAQQDMKDWRKIDGD